MSELRYTDLRTPGIDRRRSGRGFTYRAPDGSTVSDGPTRARIAALALPPAWRDVWICADPLGHIQATGADAAGRRQYRYHDRWRECRDRMKFERMLEFARLLPDLRAAVARDLADEEMSRERVLACAVRLLDRGFFRIGSEQYAEENETYGLATMCREHVRLLDGDTISFDYVAKASKRRVQSVVDPDVYAVVAKLKARRGGGPELLAYRRGSTWCDVRSTEINDYLKQHTGSEFSAKDFRTWNATLLAAVGLAVAADADRSETARSRLAAHVVKEVARYLGNTPAVCRASYIDPRVFELHAAGETIGDALDVEDSAEAQAVLDRAVLELLEHGPRFSIDGECATRPWDDPERADLLRQIARCAA